MLMGQRYLVGRCISLFLGKLSVLCLSLMRSARHVEL